MNTKIEALHKWAKFIEERVQELGLEVLCVFDEITMEKDTKRIERWVVIQWNHTDHYKADRIEVCISDMKRYMRIRYIKGLRLILEKRPHYNVERDVKQSIDSVFKKIE